MLREHVDDVVAEEVVVPCPRNSTGLQAAVRGHREHGALPNIQQFRHACRRENMCVYSSRIAPNSTSSSGSLADILSSLRQGSVETEIFPTFPCYLPYSGSIIHQMAVREGAVVVSSAEDWANRLGFGGHAVLTIVETAKVLRVCERSVRIGIKKGTIPHVRVGRRVLISVPQLVEMLARPRDGATGAADSPALQRGSEARPRRLANDDECPMDMSGSEARAGTRSTASSTRPRGRRSNGTRSPEPPRLRLRPF